MTRLGALLATLLLCSTCEAVYAGATYFEKSWTGAQLLADPSVDFPVDVPVTVEGETLFWGDVPDVPQTPYATRSAKFIEVPLVAPGVLESNAEVRVTVDFELARNRVDMQPLMTVFDNLPSGNYYSGAKLRRDGNDSYIKVEQGRFGDLNHDNFEDYRDIEDSEFISPVFLINSTPPDVLAGQFYWDYKTDHFGVSFPGYGSTFLHWPGDGPLVVTSHNLARGITFTLWLNPDDDHSGGLRSLSLRAEQVPEPTAGAMAISGAVLALRRRRRP